MVKDTKIGDFWQKGGGFKTNLYELLNTWITAKTYNTKVWGTFVKLSTNGRNFFMPDNFCRDFHKIL